MPPKRRTSEWQAPPYYSDGETKMGWVDEQIAEGEGWLQSQKAYKQLPQNMRNFDAVFNDKTKSTLVTNELKYQIRKFVETLSDMREIGTYGSDAAQFKSYAEMLNKVSKVIYLEAEFNYQLRRVLQYAAVQGRGYMWPKVKSQRYGFGERQIVFEPLGLLDVVPVQVPLTTNNVQDAYAVTVFDYMPIAEAHGRFPEFQSQLQPVDKMRFSSVVQGRRVDYAQRFRYGEEGRTFGNLYCEIRYTFINDVSVNQFPTTIPMGQPGTSWYYDVPALGSDILGGYRGGLPFMRPATPVDCLNFPNLRLIISSKGMTQPMYDGPAFDWSGEIPVVQYDIDDWPWSGIGGSLVGDVAAIETTIRKIERKMDQVITTTLNPPLGYDRTATGGPKIENFDMFAEDVRAGVDGVPRNIMQSLLPDSVKVEESHFKMLEYLHMAMGKQLGTEDIGNLGLLKMNMASETADKMLEGIGPWAKGIAGNVERSNARIARQLKFIIPQYLDTARIVSIIGPDSITPEVFDFDPQSLIPSHMPDEYIAGNVPIGASNYSKLERAKRFTHNIRLISVPNTLLKVTQMQEQLKWLQLWRGQAPIAFADVAKKMDIDNYGEVAGATLRERYINEKMQDLELEAQAQAQAQQLGLGAPPGAPAPTGQGSGGAHPPVPGSPQGRPGRKPTAHAAPQIKERPDGSSTITESK